MYGATFGTEHAARSRSGSMRNTCSVVQAQSATSDGLTSEREGAFGAERHHIRDGAGPRCVAPVGDVVDELIEEIVVDAYGD